MRINRKSKKETKQRVMSIVLVVIMVIVCFGSLLTVKASSESAIQVSNIEDLSKDECEDLFKTLLIAIVNHDINFMNQYVGVFTPECYNDMYQYIQNNDIGSNVISNVTLDFTYPDESSTGDSVVMLNTKVWYDNQTYNNLYLFEFHINSSGDIYGYNIWAY